MNLNHIEYHTKKKQVYNISLQKLICEYLWHMPYPYLWHMNMLFGYCVDSLKKICMSAGTIWFFEQFIVLCLLKLSLFLLNHIRMEAHEGSCLISRANLFFKDYLKSLHQRHGKLGQVYDNLFFVILNRIFCSGTSLNVKICQEIIRKASFKTRNQHIIAYTIEKKGNNILANWCIMCEICFFLNLCDDSLYPRVFFINNSYVILKALQNHKYMWWHTL